MVLRLLNFSTLLFLCSLHLCKLYSTRRRHVYCIRCCSNFTWHSSNASNIPSSILQQLIRWPYSLRHRFSTSIIRIWLCYPRAMVDRRFSCKYSQPPDLDCNRRLVVALLGTLEVLRLILLQLRRIVELFGIIRHKASINLRFASLK